MLGGMSPVRILHAHSTFGHGGKEARAVQLMNAFGAAAEHAVISASPGELGAREALAPAVKADFPDDAPPLTGLPGLPRLFRLSRYMRRFDLVLTYNWGAFDAVMARHLFGGPPLIHHEDGFNQDEAGELKTRRNLYRRLGLAAAHRLVVPSARLEAIARKAWAQPPAKVVRIANGIDVAALRRAAGAGDSRAREAPRRDRDRHRRRAARGQEPAAPGPRLRRHDVARAPGSSSSAPGRRASGSPPRRAALGVADRLLMPGFLADPARWIGRFDIFALSSDSEQFPISLVEAMAAGLPAVATAVGDVAADGRRRQSAADRRGRGRGRLRRRA